MRIGSLKYKESDTHLNRDLRGHLQQQWVGGKGVFGVGGPGKAVHGGRNRSELVRRKQTERLSYRERERERERRQRIKMTDEKRRSVEGKGAEDGKHRAKNSVTRKDCETVDATASSLKLKQTRNAQFTYERTQSAHCSIEKNRRG